MTCAVYAQSLPNLYFKHLNQSNGLSDPNVRSLHEDKYGFLWIGTFNGLNRFDGANCVNFHSSPIDSLNLQGNNIIHIIEDRNSDLWIGTQKGLSKYNYRYNSFKYFQFFGTDQQKTYYYAFPFYIDHLEKLWVHLAGNNYVFDERNNHLQFITAFSNGNTFVNQRFYKTLKWYVTKAPKGIFVNYMNGYQERKVMPFFMNAEKAVGPPATINHVYIESDSLVWLAGELGLIALNPISREYSTYSAHAKADNLVATCVYPYPDSDWLLVGTDGEGLLLFDKKKQAYIAQYKHLYNNPNSLAGNHIKQIYIDSKQNLFVALQNNGLDYTNLNQIIFPHLLSKEDALKLNTENDVTAIYQAKNGDIWCGTNNSGILIYDEDMKTVLHHVLAKEGVKSIVPFGDQKLIIELKGNSFLIYSLLSKSFTPVAISSSISSMGSLSINQFLKDKSSNKLFACTESGIAEVLNKNDTTLHLLLYDHINDKMEWPNVSQLIQLPSKDILVQAYYTNLYLFRQQGAQYKLIKEIARTPYNINGSVLMDNMLYLSTTSGLLTYDIKLQQLAETPLLSSYCTGIAKDNDGQLWISSNNGIYCYKPKENTFRNYGEAEGLQGPTANVGTMQCLSDGKIIIAGNNGINLFNPKDINPLDLPFRTLITRISINDKFFSHGINPILNPRLNLEHNENTITFQIVPVEFQNATHRKLSYQMLGYDEFPVEITGASEVRYAQMPYGEYVFSVKSAENTEATLMHISIAPPYWKTTWFIAICVIILSTLAVLAIYCYGKWIKNQQLQQLRIMINSQEEERKRIASDLHDDFGARLSSLKLYIQAAAKAVPEAHRETHKQTTQLLDQAIAELRNILFNLSPKTLEENGLAAAIKDLASNIERLTGIEMEVNTDTHSAQLKKTVQYALYRICQELINNTIKHASATHIYISLVYRNDSLIFLYEDNGVGFQIDNVKKGYGLTNIQTHAQAIYSELSIDSSLGKGLAATLTIPLTAIDKTNSKT
ncbi:sensor histidine kinase [Olivibacter sitiensis]|uniref:sensor histidine kinase n=1 Tax=Olivibacter sitiensis TaxID=376470 RepID=UPI00146FBA4D|nr:two-component regulator propeller domain-containing protein [Olivibacter sitiensis]